MAKHPSKADLKPAQCAAQLAQLLPGIANILYRLTNGMGCPDALTMPQFKTLQFIHSAGSNVKMSELSRMLGVAGSTLTETVKKLVAEGYIKRERSPEDDRVVLLTLTAKSRALIEGHLKTLRQFFTMICQQAGPRGAQELLTSHQFIHDTYKDILARQDGAGGEEEDA